MINLIYVVLALGGRLDEDSPPMVAIDPDCPVHENKAVKALEKILALISKAWR